VSNADNSPASDPNDPMVGQSVADGKYRIVRVIGEGGMGKVYMAEQQLGDRTRPVAIKTLLPELGQDAQIVQRFHREAGTVSLLEHPNTIKFFESGKLADGQNFVAMEFIQGESLAHIIARGPLNGPRAEFIMQQVCGSLQEAHEHGIVHRDLKPENIVLTQKGQKGDFVKVLDFGIAKRDESEETANAKLTRQGMVLGTPPYMSPEQFTGQPLKPTSDVYSLGVVGYEMLTGVLPFEASTPWEWATKHLTQPPRPFEQTPVGMQINPRHKAAVMHALAKNPTDRPQSTTDFLREFTGDASAGGDWAVSTNTAQGGGFAGHNSNPTPMAPMGGLHTAPSGSGGVGQAGIAATMAVPSYGNPTPQSFQGVPSGQGFNPVQPSNPGGYTPAPSNAGFQAMQPPSNPGFNPVQQGGYGSMQGGYGSMQGGYGSMQGAPPKSGGSGKIIGIAAAFLGLVVIGAVFALRGNDDPPSNNTNSTSNAPTTPTPTPDPNNQAVNPTIMPQPVQVPVAVPTTPDNSMQAIPNNTIQAIPNTNIVPEPNNNIQVVPPPNDPPPRRPSAPAICSQGARIDDMILNGRCSSAQGLARSMRAAGCRRIPLESFGSACPAP
jgi:serine/threonine protein kinase